MICGKCETENRQGRKFCSACGAGLDVACAACGFRNDPDDRFCGGCGAALTANAPVQPTAARSVSKAAPIAPSVAAAEVADDDARNERRQVTILFADISGFTEISKALDPEDAHALLQEYFGIADRVIESFGGRVDKHIGDAVMALFGAPVAHGDDPMRAVRSALELHTAVKQLVLQDGSPISIHVGIASGEVVAGALGGVSREYTVVGDSVNLAAWLQENCPANDTLISDSVRLVVEGKLSCEPVSIEGEDPDGKTVLAWRVTEGDLRQRRGETRVPMIGRDSYVRQFRSILTTAADQKTGEALLIRAEPGVGKTRLIEEFMVIAADSGFDVHAAQILDFGAGEGQDAIRMLVRSLLGLSDKSSIAEKVEAVARACDGGLVAPEQVLFLTELAGAPIPADQKVAFDAMDYRTRWEGKKATLACLVCTLGLRAPILVCIDDLQWAHQVTLDYIAHLLESIVEFPVVIVLSTRVENDPLQGPWRGLLRDVALVEINLTPLGRADSLRLARQLMTEPSPLFDECVARADGNPLFLEQLLRSIQTQDRMALPATIQSLILSRMDRLSATDRSALQAAAAIGQIFDLDALRHVCGMPDYEARPLIESQLVRSDGGRYRFSHSLIRDGAYSSLVRSSARQLHKAAAAYFRTSDTGLAAEHLDKAGDPIAPKVYLEAAWKKQEVHHFQQASEYVGRALLLAKDAQMLFDLHCCQGQIYRTLGQSSASVEAYARARDIAPNEEGRCDALIGMVESMRDASEADQAMALLDLAQDIAERQELMTALAQIHGRRGDLHFPRGQVEACLAEQRQSLRLAKIAGSVELEVKALSGLGDAEYARGHMATAHNHFSECVERCRQNSLPQFANPNLALRGLTAFYCGRPKDAVHDCLEAVRASTSSRQARAELVARTAVAPALIEMLRLPEAEVEAETAAQLADRLGARRFLPECLSFKSRLRRLNGQSHEAERLAREAVGLSMENDAAKAFAGPWALGTLALVTSNADVRVEALTKGAALLEDGCVSHNHLWFFRDAIEASLVARDWASAAAYADRLEDFTAREPLGWSALYIDLATTMASGHGQSEELRSIADRARVAGLALCAELADRLAAA
jgi:class 3 adenylate cyclase/tetratricopeptide (TPR) repeat protein